MRKTHSRQGTRSPKSIDFDAVNNAALAVLPALASRWMSDGYRRGTEWIARNPRRNDRKPGSFSVNLTSGRWADFATGDRGGDVVSLAAYLAGSSQIEAARALSLMLGINSYE